MSNLDLSKSDAEYLAPYETCTCKDRLDDDGRPMKPDLCECGTCGWTWCFRCHPAPSARSWCEGTDEHAKAAREHELQDELRAQRRAKQLLEDNGYKVTRD